jgi:hypothetical protein
MRMRFSAVVAFLACALALLSLFALPGCGGRAPATKAEQRQTQNVADAKAGMAVLRDLLPPDVQRLIGPVITTQFDDIVAGASAFAEASAGDLQVPASTWTPAKIAANPAEYRRAGQSALRTAQGTQVWFWFKVIGGGIGSVALSFGLAVLSKELPGIGPVIGTLAEGLWQRLTPAATKEEDEARTILAGHASSVLEVAAAALPPGEAQRAVAKLPPEVVEAAARIGIALPARPSPALVDALAGAVARAATIAVPPASATT